MKRGKSIYLFSLLYLLLSVSSHAQNDEISVKKLVENIFDKCRAENFQSAREFIVYTGKDNKRNLRDKYNFRDKSEENQVKRMCKKIYALIEISDEYSFSDYNHEIKDGTEWHYITVHFLSGGQELKNTFKIIKLENNYLLADID
ncbi:MAG: hypothetical protein K9J16_00975 [Melioribacteraceae bacterium]|nr:hypothetical protein [Melioribacteraceae bacterium]MCF8354020.1 hypothetical protein [Melioribacteraceae bacterium]MCF8392299.1 hypothetical protein [Melioribacteraceae bacterium]MCF8417631.1 hypothetical protein [Melioribacteraceae bacterium]